VFLDAGCIVTSLGQISLRPLAAAPELALLSSPTSSFNLLSGKGLKPPFLATALFLSWSLGSIFCLRALSAL
jgi:hypothetical protein